MTELFSLQQWSAGSLASKQQSKVTADLNKNRLCIAIGNSITKVELNKVYTDIRLGVSDLKPGFDAITDLSRCTFSHFNAIATFKKIMDYLIAQKIGRVVRIVVGTSSPVTHPDEPIPKL